MKFLIAIFFFISPQLYAENRCPKEFTVIIQCTSSEEKFQLLDHLGIYTNPKMDIDQKDNLLICTYGSKAWRSQYRYHDRDIEKIISVSSLKGLADVVRLVDSMGFRVDHFGINSNPFATLIFKMNRVQFTPVQMFLFSGLENTFDNNNSNFSVDTLDKRKFSTVVINERYLKSQNAAADTFVTGSNCSVRLNNY